MNKKFPSISDVAKLANTSIGTVSNVLNSRCNVSEALCNRVQIAAKELGYSASPIAQSMRRRKTKTISVIILDINCIFFSPVLKGIQKVLSKANYSMVIYDTNYNPQNEIKYLAAAQNNWADGVILAGAANSQNRGIYNKFNSTDSGAVPLVSLETDLTEFGIDSVMINCREAAFTATKHLIELKCKRIVHIKAHVGTSSYTERYQGYIEALQEANICVDEELVIQGDYSPLSGYNAIHELILSGVKFDGIFASNDQMAVGAMRALYDTGIRIPEDVKIVGFDNTFVTSIVQPALTTISVPTYKMGITAANCIINRIENRFSLPRSVQLSYELIIRNSTLASAKTSFSMEYW